MIQVEGHKNLFRNSETGAIINMDNTEYESYIMLREQRKKEKLEIETLKNEVGEIKALLKELINESKRNYS